MARLIDADKLMDEINQQRRASKTSFPKQSYVVGDVLNSIFNSPTVDAVEVVHGRWIDHMVRDWRCSECGEPIYKVRNVDGYCYDDKPNYCPNCGAMMDGERGDNG